MRIGGGRRSAWMFRSLWRRHRQKVKGSWSPQTATSTMSGDDQRLILSVSQSNRERADRTCGCKSLSSRYNLSKMKIAILTSGGDSAGMNAAVRSIVKCGILKYFIFLLFGRCCTIYHKEVVKCGSSAKATKAWSVATPRASKRPIPPSAQPHSCPPLSPTQICFTIFALATVIFYATEQVSTIA